MLTFYGVWHVREVFSSRMNPGFHSTGQMADSVYGVVSSAHEKWGQKQKCCIYNFGQCRLQKHVSNTFSVRFLIKVPEE